MIGYQQPVGMIGGMPAGAAITSMPAANQAAPITANTTVAPVAMQQPMASAQNGAPPIGLIGAEQALMQGKTAAEQALDASYWRARDESAVYRDGISKRQLSLDATPSADVINPLNEAAANFDPYMQTGQSADKLYADLTGSNGPEAQAAAQAAYQSSPALQYQIDQMQKVTERSAAARGGLLGGRVALELQKNAQGLTSQDYFKNLGALDAQANRGISAAGQVGTIRSNQAGIAANLQSQKMQAQAQYEMQKEQIRNDVAGRLTSLAENYGINKAGLNTGFSQVVGGMREGAGYAVAQNANQAAGNISSILQNQGVQISEMMGKDIASLTDMIYQSGMQDKTDMQNLATILANITGGQASNVMQGQNTIGAAQAAGTVDVANAVTQGLGTYLGTTGGAK